MSLVSAILPSHTEHGVGVGGYNGAVTHTYITALTLTTHVTWIHAQFHKESTHMAGLQKFTYTMVI